MLSLWLSLLLTAEPPTALVTACTKGTARSCYELGLWHLDAAHRDDRRALAALGDGCRRGSAEACNSAGVLLNDSEVLARDPETTETWLRQACDRGLPLGCSNAALFVRIQGGDASALERRAYELAEKACAAGDATSCRVQYELVTRLDPAPMTTEQRTQFAARACNRGADWACGALAYSLWALESAARNPEEALRLSRGPCERNEPLACGVVAADALERKDDAAAAAPAAIACDGGLMEFCEVRGVFLLEGRGGLTKNAARGVELVERTCLAGGASACRYLLGRRALVPAGRVAALERALCESGDAAQCRALLSRGGLSPAVRTTAQGVLCEAEHQVAACEAFAQTLDAERRSPARAQAARVIACQGGSRPACRAALATETAPTARLPLLERLCHPPDELAACREWVTLRRTTPGATPRELLAATVLACVTAQECATLEDDIARARVAERAATFSLLEEACARPDGLRVCAPALAQAKLSGANTTIFEATLCEAGDGAACEARGAALRAATPARAVWFSAEACRLGRPAGCEALRQAAAFDLARAAPQLSNALLAEQLAARQFVLELGPLPPRARPAQSSARLERYRPDPAALQQIRARRACDAFVAQGLPPAALRLEAQVLDADALPADVTLEGGELRDGKAALPVCADAYQFTAPVPEGSFGAFGRGTLREGPLVLNRAGTGFEPIRWRDEVAQAARPATWRPDGFLALGLEAMTTVPGASEQFPADTGTLLIRVQGATRRSLELSVRFGAALPVGPRNPFGLLLGLGTALGVLGNDVVQWRALTGALDAWLTIEPLGLSLAPTLGTQVAFALGEQELSLELGVRLPIALVQDDAAQRPLSLHPALFGALLFRPSF